MKKGFLIIVIISSSFFSTFAQENPWLPKGENPWGEYEKTEKSTVENEPKKENQPNEEQLKTNEHLGSDSLVKLENSLYEEAATASSTAYKCRKEFILGCAFGIIFPTGIVPCAITVATNNKQEKQLVNKIESKDEYEQLEDKKLNKKIKRAIKNKKLESTLAGMATGIGTKLLVIYIIALSKF